MLLGRRDVIIAKFLWIMRGTVALAVIGNYDVFPEVGKERKNI